MLQASSALWQSPGSVCMSVQGLHLSVCLCRHSMDNRGGKKAKHNMAQLVEMEIPGTGPPRAPVAADASVDELIGKTVM